MDSVEVVGAYVIEMQMMGIIERSLTHAFRTAMWCYLQPRLVHPLKL